MTYEEEAIDNLRVAYLSAVAAVGRMKAMRIVNEVATEEEFGAEVNIIE